MVATMVASGVVVQALQYKAIRGSGKRADQKGGRGLEPR